MSIVKNIEIENILINITRDAYLSRALESTPSGVLRNFVYSLFEGGTNTVGSLKIVSFNNSELTGENRLWTTDSKIEFCKYDLLTIVTPSYAPEKTFVEISRGVGSDVWRFASKVINHCNDTHISEVEKQTTDVLDVWVGNVAKYKDFDLVTLKDIRDDLENVRREKMLEVARAQACGNGNKTSVNVKEFYAERLSMKIDVLDSAIELKMEQK